MNVSEYLCEINMSRSRLSELCGVHEKTIKNWIKRGWMPFYAEKICELWERDRQLWTGWRVNGDYLISSDGVEIHKDEARAATLYRIYFYELKHRLERLKNAPVQYLIDF